MMTLKTVFQLQGAMLAGFAVVVAAVLWLPGHFGQVALLVAWLVVSLAVYVRMRRRWPVTRADESQVPPLAQIANGGGMESLFEVRVADDRLVVRHPAEDEVIIALADVEAVSLDTDDSGPFGSDVRWVLRAGERFVVIPLGATGEDALLAWVQSLPGVDNEAIVTAMGSTSIGRFPVWTGTRAPQGE